MKENGPMREVVIASLIFSRGRKEGELLYSNMGLGVLLLLLVVLPFHAVVEGWRKEEFRTCDQTPFCKQARLRSPRHAADLEVTSVRLAYGEIHAKILSPPSSLPLDLCIAAYDGGILRVKVNEDGDAGTGWKKPLPPRFEVPDVLDKDLDGKKLPLLKITPIGGDGEYGWSFDLSSGLEVVVVRRPFEIFVREGNARVLSFNSKGLFHFEQRRERKTKEKQGKEVRKEDEEKEGEEEEEERWEEHFRTHTDSRPRGPQSISFDVSFHGSPFVYGIPEHATGLALKPTRGPGVESEPYRLFNLDVFEYIAESPFGLYGAIPFMLSHSLRRSSGFFWLNSAEMSVDVFAQGWDNKEEGTEKDHLAPSNLQVDTHWMSESGIVDAFFFVGPSPKDLLRQYTTVTGLPAMPQLFSIAYHQSRWNYKDEQDVYSVDSSFDSHDIPYDVLWLDIEHTDGKRYFTFDKFLFPNPKEMQEKLQAKGRRMVTIVDPHIKRDDGFPLHKEAVLKGYYVKDAHGHDFDGWCWPGSSSYLDMLNPEIRDWWAGKFSYSSYAGSTPSLYIWNDMNEPSVFNGPEATMPRDCVHYGGVEHRDVHNAYGYYFHMATADGLLKRSEGKDRPFVLSRAFFAGTQKIGPVWTGDNTAHWDHLRVSIPMILSLGLTGLSFTGADVGGFFGNPDPELLTRWYQLAAYYPFFRGHAHLDTKRREPWLFGEPYTSIIRESIHMRYALLPYFYTLFWEASMTGVPVMRPLWMEFPQEERTFGMDKECMVGGSLLVHGVYSEGATSETIYFPGSQPWYDVRSGAVYQGGGEYEVHVTLESIPVFQRAGTVIPRKDRLRRSSSQMINDPYTLVVALNSSLEAEGEVYIDDGKSFEYREGAYIHRRFVLSGGKLSSFSVGGHSNSAKKFAMASVIVERIVILGLSREQVGEGSIALVGPSNRRVEIEAGPLSLHKGAHFGAFVVRKPNVPIAEDWSIKLF